MKYVRSNNDLTAADLNLLDGLRVTAHGDVFDYHWNTSEEHMGWECRALWPKRNIRTSTERLIRMGLARRLTDQPYRDVLVITQLGSDLAFESKKIKEAKFNSAHVQTEWLKSVEESKSRFDQWVKTTRIVSIL